MNDTAIRLAETQADLERVRAHRDKLLCLLSEFSEKAHQRDTLLQENVRLHVALEEAANDLGKAANQFASMRESQRVGFNPPIRDNPEKFEEKEAKARAALKV